MAQIAPKLFDVPSAAAQLSISRRTLYALIERGSLSTCKIGRRRLIPAVAIENFVAAQMTAGSRRRGRK